MTRVTLGKSRVRESRPPGSVRAKPNGRATRPRPEGLTSPTAKLAERRIKAVVATLCRWSCDEHSKAAIGSVWTG
ncbi:hypothetical protein CWO91_41065 [Bradyrhizobium genosp. SA-3]|nr:hypothetical protein CWO91_41065 [Bradyrhizobium genosp. SA-3]